MDVGTCLSRSNRPLDEGLMEHGASSHWKLITKVVLGRSMHIHLWYQKDCNYFRLFHLGKNTVMEKINKARKSENQTVAHRWQFFKSLVLIAMGKMKNHVNVRQLSASLWVLQMEPFCKKVCTFYPHAYIYLRTNHLNFPPLCGFSHEIHLKISSFSCYSGFKGCSTSLSLLLQPGTGNKSNMARLHTCTTAEKQ